MSADAGARDESGANAVETPDAPRSATPFRRRLLRRMFVAVILGWFFFLWLHQVIDRPGDPIDVGVIAAPRATSTPNPNRGELRGRVRTVDGASAADVLVTLVVGEELHWARTDALGTFAISGLPRGRGYVTVVPLAAPGFDLDIELPASGPIELELPPPFPPTPTLPEIRAQTLAGRVDLPFERAASGYAVVAVPYEVSASGGAPLAAPGLDGRVERRVFVDRSGWFRFDELALGSYELRVLPPWAGADGWPVLGTLVMNHNGRGEVPIVNATNGAIEGTVIGIDNKPIEGAVVRVASAADALQRFPTVTTDVDGRFVIEDAPEGALRVLVRAGTRWSERTVRLAPQRREQIEMRPVLGQ